MQKLAKKKVPLPGSGEAIERTLQDTSRSEKLGGLHEGEGKGRSRREEDEQQERSLEELW